MVIKNIFTFGQEVYLKTDGDQKKRIVTGFLVEEANFVKYRLSCGSDDAWHFGFEISEDKDVIMSTSN